MRLLLLVPIFALTGCAAAVNIIPPTQTDENKVITVDGGYDKAWNGVIDWFAANHITIDKLDKESGIVTAKHKLLVDNNELNCGTVSGSGTYQMLGNTKTLLLNVIVRQQTDDTATVRMNLSGMIYVNARNWDTGANISTTGSCLSTGLLERDLASYL
ncbi:hypothetical protein [Shewanella sp. 10N.286.54.B9]|uniref:hypothetical protein n=1 Tax=Shewanella sp. 10N.286.54.B9 TaxID=3229719 RepID=UPI00354F265C